ncbi:MAG TPA: purine nucleoside permease [Steroidobacteraceae bacterium]|nr:purine nucleoside permease [Steroidobacteraceae bacterium]
MTRRALSWLLPAVLMAGAAVRGSATAPAAAELVPVKVMVVSMFGLEAAPWLKALKITREIAVPGLSSDFPLVRCSADGVCQMTSSMGHANAAASIMAVAYSGRFDLRRTYFLIAGIAGIDPDRGTIGSATWARFAVDAGIAHEVDVRDLPKDWNDGYYGVLTNSPDQKPRFDYHTEVFRLNEALLQRALALSKDVQLADSDDVRAYRAHYPKAPANQPPQVIQCDTASGDTWWAGPHLEEHARHWVKLLTDNQGVYCTTQQEDNATMIALTRASQSGLVDLRRVAILRTASDFDRPYPGQSTVDGLHAQLAIAGAGTISTDNLVKAGMPLVEAIVANWPQWQAGVPAN